MKHDLHADSETIGEVVVLAVMGETPHGPTDVLPVVDVDKVWINCSTSFI